METKIKVYLDLYEATDNIMIQPPLTDNDWKILQQ